MKANPLNTVITLLILLQSSYSVYPSCFNKPCTFEIPNTLIGEIDKKSFIKLLEDTTCDLSDTQAEYISGILFRNQQEEGHPHRKSLEKIFLRKISELVSYESVEMNNKGYSVETRNNAIKKYRTKECDTHKTVANIVEHLKTKSEDLDDFFQTAAETLILVKLSSKIEISDFERLLDAYVENRQFTSIHEDGAEELAFVFSPLAELLKELTSEEALRIIEHFQQRKLKIHRHLKTPEYAHHTIKFIGNVVKQIRDIKEPGKLETIFKRIEKVLENDREVALSSSLKNEKKALEEEMHQLYQKKLQLKKLHSKEGVVKEMIRKEKDNFRERQISESFGTSYKEF